jgi:site-specific DNA-cytosine methylase
MPNLGNVEGIDADAIEPVDLVVFGSPCQSFSVAGRRLGLDDPRGNLALVALRLVERLRPRWFVFENVPGLLSSDGGRDFGAFLGTVALSVRRLTPREAERLQGFPDDFTAVTYRGKPAADGPRYRALGNSMAVPVIGWVLGRIRAFEERAER